MSSKKMTHNSFIEKVYNIIINQMYYFMIALSIVVFVLSCVFGYWFWTKHKDKIAQRDFGTLTLEFHKVSQEKSPSWDALFEKFQNGFNKHAHSSMAPYYLAYQARILLEQNKLEDALLVLNELTSRYSSFPLINAFKMEKALVGLNVNDEKIVQESLADLRLLAYDVNNQFKDTALFYLGRYYWFVNQLEEARQAWQTLLDEQRDEKIAPSPWTEEVKSYLSLVIV